MKYSLNKQIFSRLKLLISWTFPKKNFTGIVEFPIGDKIWYVNNKLHRIDGPAVETVDGTREWYLNNKLHRIDGPAVETVDGTREWYLNGKRHRTNGPAVEYTNGYKTWYLNGFQYSEKEWQKEIHRINHDKSFK